MAIHCPVGERKFPIQSGFFVSPEIPRLFIVLHQNEIVGNEVEALESHSAEHGVHQVRVLCFSLDGGLDYYKQHPREILQRFWRWWLSILEEQLLRSDGHNDATSFPHVLLIKGGTTNHGSV